MLDVTFPHEEIEIMMRERERERERERRGVDSKEEREKKDIKKT